MALSWGIKDPDEVLDYRINWAARLTGGDTISASEWLFAAGDGLLVIDSDTSDATSATAWLSAGTNGTSYELTNRVTTVGGRIMDQTVRLMIGSK